MNDSGNRGDRMSAFTIERWDTTGRSVARIEFTDPRAECRTLQVEATPKGRKIDVFMDPSDTYQQVRLHLPDGSEVRVSGSDFFSVDVHRPDGSFAGFVMTSEPEPEPA